MRAAVLVTAALFFCPAAGFAAPVSAAEGPATACVPAPTDGAAPASAPDAQTTAAATVTLASADLVRGQRLGGTSLQPQLELDGVLPGASAPGSWGAGLWIEEPLAGRISGQSDPEVDPYGYLRLPVSARWALIPGFQAYAYPGASEATASGPPEGSARTGLYRRTRLELNLTAEAHAGPVTLNPEIAYDLRLQGPVASWAASGALPLTSLGTELDGRMEAGAFAYRRVGAPAVAYGSGSGDSAPGPFASPEVPSRLTGAYAQAGLSVPYRLSSRATATAGWTYAAGLDQRLHPRALPSVGPVPNPLEARQAAWSLAWAWSF